MIPIYLDYAAATPLDERVLAAMEPYLRQEFYNPSAPYLAAKRVRAAVEEARHQLAMVIGARADEITLTAGATESVNLAIHGVMRTHPESHIVTTAIEHAAVTASVGPYRHSFAVVDARGYVTPAAITAAITDQTVLVSVALASSELGTVQPLADIARAITDIRQDRRRRGVTQPIYFHTDASAAAGHLTLAVHRLGVDLMTLAAAKCYGPKQVALLWTTPDVMVTPLITGGGQEGGRRSGTENVAGIIGFATALTVAEQLRKEQVPHLAQLRDELQRQIVAACPDVVINGHPSHHLPSHLHISLAGLDGERAVFALDERGIMVSTGAACSANQHTGSAVLRAIGMDEQMVQGSLRFSLGRPTTDDEIARAAQGIIEVLQTERGK